MKDYISEIYKNRENFFIIGLTGKTGSGCTTVASLLNKGYTNYDPIDVEFSKLEKRRANIIKKFINVKFQKNNINIKTIKPSSIIILIFLLKYYIITSKDNKHEYPDTSSNINDINLIEQTERFRDLLFNDTEINDILNKLFGHYDEYFSTTNNKKPIIDSDKNIERLMELLRSKKNYQNKPKPKLRIIRELKININDYKLKQFSKDKYKEFIDTYERFSNRIQNMRDEGILSVSDLQKIGDLVRSQTDIFQIPRYCNYLIKSYRRQTKNCLIIIDSIKNPFEIIFFKERYSAYYTFSIHTENNNIYNRLNINGMKTEDIKLIHGKESNIDIKNQKNSLNSKEDFNSQNIHECIQRSDVYIDNNRDRHDHLLRQLFKYLSLIIHPGIITPSKDEMTMQLALTAKFKSGCISRQVGAVLLNAHGSIKSIGWNEVPEGQTPCLFRSHSELRNGSDLDDYSNYEKSAEFRKNNNFLHIYNQNNANQYYVSNTIGLNDSFCFKSVQNRIEGNKNQVYTRSLHAEENAFLQASKYGNSDIIGGELFTTASPCFLCAKKAYQLGIKRIVYIEAYPDISNEQVLQSGDLKIIVSHFRGAIGLAYQKLYEPMFSYKDELKALNTNLTRKKN